LKTIVDSLLTVIQDFHVDAPCVRAGTHVCTYLCVHNFWDILHTRARSAAAIRGNPKSVFF